jgi:phosphatidylglycerophosphate synthase
MSHNTWIHRIARVTVSKPLARTKIKPDQLTTVRLATGLAAAAAIGVSLPVWQHVGAILFVVSMVLDRADGDLARLTGQTSPAGHRYDLIADGVANAVAFIGLGFGLRNGTYGLWALPMGLAAGMAVAGILILAMQMEEERGARAAELPSVAGFDADDAMLLLPLAVWFGKGELLLAVASVGAPVFCVFFYWLMKRRLAAPKAD